MTEFNRLKVVIERSPDPWVRDVYATFKEYLGDPTLRSRHPKCTVEISLERRRPNADAQVPIGELVSWTAEECERIVGEASGAWDWVLYAVTMPLTRWNPATKKHVPVTCALIASLISKEGTEQLGLAVFHSERLTPEEDAAFMGAYQAAKKARSIDCDDWTPMETLFIDGLLNFARNCVQVAIGVPKDAKLQ